MRALDKKLLRDLWGMKGQALAIALVIAGGIATYVMSSSTLDSLKLTRARYYRDYRFADVFVSLKRAPESLKERLSSISGVERVETRVVAPVNVSIEGFPDPVTGRIVSIPEGGEGPLLNRLYLRTGRLVEPGRDDEVILSEPFANAHALKPSDRLSVVINGKRKVLTIVGIGLTPEYIFEVPSGSAFPDFARFGVMWMGRSALGSAFNMDKAFNDAVLTLSRGSVEEDVIDSIDGILRPYGGFGATGRKDQVSNRYLSEEFKQLGRMAVIFPSVFLSVAAFLLNIVLSRLINTEREQIAILKAFGYGNNEVALHYLKLVLCIAVIGIAGGLGAGVWLGKSLSDLYMRFYRFPFLTYELRPYVMAVSAAVSLGAALSGTIFALRRVAVLPPAEAMRPEAPTAYRETLVERMGLKRLFSQPGRMILRHIERRFVKSALSVIGIAFACSIMVAGTFFGDSIDYMVNVQFVMAQSQDVSVTFNEPASRSAVYDLEGISGITYAEPFRTVPVIIRHGHRSYRTVIDGIDRDARLRRLLDMRLKPIHVPAEGLVLPDYLGKLLGVRPGDTVTIESLEGRRTTREVPVASLASQFIGVTAYMDLSALNRFMGEGEAVSGADITIDEDRKNEIYGRLRDIPAIAGISARKDAVRNFFKTMADQVLIFTFFNTMLAGTIAFGVVYNSARIALSERGRELASLRVLGFTRAEISYILLGEFAILTLAAIPLGFLIGKAVGAYMAHEFQNELYRIPLVISAHTYAVSAAVVLASAVFSGLIMRYKLDRLDLVAVLKAKE